MNEKTEVLFDIGDEKLMTIGAVVDRLKGEFPDVSVSKLRYLEEQGLVAPRRTKGGYRLFSRDDYQRLIRVLALQRDEYLPLKVIRKEIERRPGRHGPGRRAAGCARPTSCPTPPARRNSPPKSCTSSRAATRALLAELEEFELIKGRQVSGVRRYTELEAERGRARCPPGPGRPAAQEPARHEERRRPPGRTDRAGHAAGAALASR